MEAYISTKGKPKNTIHTVFVKVLWNTCVCNNQGLPLKNDLECLEFCAENMYQHQFYGVAAKLFSFRVGSTLGVACFLMLIFLSQLFGYVRDTVYRHVLGYVASAEFQQKNR